eukprot:scaffold9933_cov125-Isochrysis_galbana.AAC.6
MSLKQNASRLAQTGLSYPPLAHPGSSRCGDVPWEHMIPGRVRAPLDRRGRGLGFSGPLRERSPGVYSLTTPTHRGGVMCKALAGSGRCSGHQICRHSLALWQNWG